VDQKNRVWIIGFSPLNGETDFLLFSIGDIMHTEQEPSDSSVPFLTVGSDRDALPRDASLASSRGPSDINLIGSNIFNRSSDLLRRNAADDSSSSDSSDDDS
jgi:hypothetical protein